MSPRTAPQVLDAPATDRMALDPHVDLSPGYHELPIAILAPSPLNPRRQATDLTDLAASIKAHGILEPLLGRAGGRGVEIVAGERRYHAARMVGLQTVPVILRELTDAGVLEHAIVENNQRADVHPLDEAKTFEQLQKLDAGYTLERIAATIGRPVAYVRNRLRLLTLIGDARKAFNDGILTLGHAQLLAKLTPEQQGRALKTSCFEREFDYESGQGQRIVGPARLSDLQHFINDNLRLDPAAVETQEDFPELAADVAAATAAGATVLMLVDSWAVGPAKPGDPLTREHFTEVKKGTKGAQLGVFVQGRRRGKTVWVTPKAKEKTPPPPAKTSAKKTPPPAASPKAKAAAAAEKAAADLRQVRSREVQRRAALELVKRVKPSHLLTAPALRLMTLSLAGAPGFEGILLQAVATAAGVSPKVFDFHGDKERLKLSVAKLAIVAAVQAVGAEAEGSGRAADAFDAFGVDIKAIDKAVAKEQAAAAKKTDARAPGKASGKKTAKKSRR